MTPRMSMPFAVALLSLMRSPVPFSHPHRFASRQAMIPRIPLLFAVALLSLMRSPVPFNHPPRFVSFGPPPISLHCSQLLCPTQGPSAPLPRSPSPRSDSPAPGEDLPADGVHRPPPTSPPYQHAHIDRASLSARLNGTMLYGAVYKGTEWTSAGHE